MIGILKKKAQSLAITVISILIALQIIMPTTVDLVLGVLILGVVYAVVKFENGKRR